MTEPTIIAATSHRRRAIKVMDERAEPNARRRSSRAAVLETTDKPWGRLGGTVPLTATADATGNPAKATLCAPRTVRKVFGVPANAVESSTRPTTVKRCAASSRCEPIGYPFSLVLIMISWGPDG